MTGLTIKALASGLALAGLWGGTQVRAQPFTPRLNEEVVFGDAAYVFLGPEGCPSGQVRVRPADQSRDGGRCVRPSELSPVPPPPPPVVVQAPAVAYAPPPPAPVPAEAVGASAPILGTEFALPLSNLGPIPTLTVVLTTRNEARNEALCTAFNAERSYSDVVGDSRVARNVIPVRWLLTADIGGYEDCAANVRSFDFARGRALLAQAEAALRAGDTPGDFSGRGPFFVQQIAGERGITFVVVDLSETDGTQFPGLGGQLGQALAAQSRALNRPANAPVPELRASGPALRPVGGTAAQGSAAEQMATTAGDLAAELPGVQRGCTALRDPWVSTAAGLLRVFLGPLNAVLTIADRFCTASAGGRAGG